VTLPFVAVIRFLGQKAVGRKDDDFFSSHNFYLVNQLMAVGTLQMFNYIQGYHTVKGIRAKMICGRQNIQLMELMVQLPLATDAQTRLEQIHAYGPFYLLLKITNA